MPADNNATFSLSTCVQLLAQNRGDDLSTILLEVLDRVGDMNIYERSADTSYFADVFIQTLTFCFCQPSFQPGPQAAARFVNHNGTIANFAVVSRFGTTDIALGILLKQQNALAKILTLYSPLSSFKLDSKTFFDADPVLASRWWFAYLDARWIVSAEVLGRIRDHFAHMDERLTVMGTNYNSPYFLVTYADLEREAAVKERINQLVRK